MSLEIIHKEFVFTQRKIDHQQNSKGKTDRLENFLQYFIIELNYNHRKNNFHYKRVVLHRLEMDNY